MEELSLLLNAISTLAAVVSAVKAVQAKTKSKAEKYYQRR